MTELKQLARSQKKSRSVLLAASVLSGASIVAQAYFIVAIVDHIFLQEGTFLEIFPLMGGLLAALLARCFFNYVNRRTGVQMAAKVKKDMRRQLLKKYSLNPLQASLKGQSGQRVSVLMDAVDEIDSYFSHYYPQTIQSSVIPLMMLAAIFSFNWVSGLILVVTAPFIPIMMIVIGKNTEKKSEEQMEKMSIFSGRFLDLLQGLSTLKFFGKAKEKQAVLRQSSLDYRDATMEVLKVAFLSSLMLEFISMLSISLVALEVGLRLMIYDQLTFFTAFFVLILVPEFFASLKELGSAFHTGRGSMGAADRIAHELKEDEQTVQWGDAVMEKTSAPPRIDISSASFSYGDSRFALKNMNAAIPPYSHTAVIGPSGSGKSTLLRLISGLIAPVDGDVLVQQKKLHSYSETDWFSRLSHITQHPYVFAGTVADNIALGAAGSVSKEEIEAAAEKAGISSLIADLPDGIETRIGEGGRGLSGGEMQRLALARAFVKKPSVILFDEPTTGLDLRTEQILQKSIEELGRGATIITVAHRLHTITQADQILFLQDGELAAAGTHESLLADSAEYRQMVRTQQGGETG